MDTFVVELWDDEGTACTFYTVRWDDQEMSETDRFLNRFADDPDYREDIEKLLDLLTFTIGEVHGATDKLINRSENEVMALPPKGKVILGEVKHYYPHFGLRIYLLKITDHLMILFGGGAKTARTTQESGTLSLTWREACHFTRVIMEAIQDETIRVDEEKRKLFYYNGSEEIVLN